MPKLKQLSTKIIRSWRPCYSPDKYADADWRGTILDILKHRKIEPQDKLWCARKCLNDKTLRLFAVDCARRALKLDKKPDERSINACDVAERYANKKATIEELREASNLAWQARSDKYKLWSAAAAAAAAAYTAAADAAAAAAAAAYTAAAAAADAAYTAADAAADAAAAAAAAAAYTAADAAADAAAAAAAAAAEHRLLERKLQVKQLIKIIGENYDG